MHGGQEGRPAATSPSMLQVAGGRSRPLEPGLRRPRILLRVDRSAAVAHPSFDLGVGGAVAKGSRRTSPNPSFDLS
jgi:hypothetical protein